MIDRLIAVITDPLAKPMDKRDAWYLLGLEWQKLKKKLESK